jgi:pimeloyl-ACP methyl ester carboxylesterase
MQLSEKRNYVLVHGAWAGGWVWQQVAELLRSEGHGVTSPTLTGLGERRHLLSDSVNLDTHVEDVVACMEMEGLTNVVLVGWSYGGMVTSGVLARVQEKIQSMVYLDAFVAESGKSVADYFDPDEPNPITEFALKGKNLPPFIPLEAFGVTEKSIQDWVKPRLGEQPYNAFLQKSKALPDWPKNIPHTYIRCTKFQNPILDKFLTDSENNPDVDTHILDMSHFPMLTDVEAITRILINVK